MTQALFQGVKSLVEAILIQEMTEEGSYVEAVP